MCNGMPYLAAALGGITASYLISKIKYRRRVIFFADFIGIIGIII